MKELFIKKEYNTPVMNIYSLNEDILIVSNGTDGFFEGEEDPFES